MVWSLQMESGTTEWHWCSSGAVHVHKACPAGCGHSTLSLPATAASPVFLAAIVMYSLLLYDSNRRHVCNKNLVKLRKNAFNLLKPFPIKERSQFSNETHAVCKPELWEFFSKARGGGPSQGCRVALQFAVCTRVQSSCYPVLQAK